MESPQRLAYLFRRHMDKTITPEEKDEFFLILLHAEHDDQLRRMIADTWNEDLPSYPQEKVRADLILRRITNWREPESPPDPFFSARLRTLVFNRWVAAALIVIALIPPLYFHLFSGRHRTTKVLTPPPAVAAQLPAADRCITLPDGSKILLHRSAQLDYRTGFTANRREVTLHGEAYFDIHRDTRPFIVHTGAIRTTVLGTAFDIDANNERKIVITVTKGKVKVENDHGEVSILRRNEQLSVDSTHLHLQKTAVDAGQTLTWKKTYVLFNDVPIRDAMAELAQRFHLTVVFANPAAENCPVTASFIQGESVEAMIEVLTKVNNMEYAIDHGRVTITGDGCK